MSNVSLFTIRYDTAQEALTMLRDLLKKDIPCVMYAPRYAAEWILLPASAYSSLYNLSAADSRFEPAETKVIQVYIRYAGHFGKRL
jgi:hypothetical protein